MDILHEREALCRLVKTRQLANGLWGEYEEQGVIEATSLALLALREEVDLNVVRATKALQSVKNRDGSWPVFAGGAEGCWVTALAIYALLATRKIDVQKRSIEWLLKSTGREANWFWRWKFQNIDNDVKFDPAKYGWSWVRDTTSWVIPTAFTLMTLRRIRAAAASHGPRLNKRIDLGFSMLLDRMCPGGGWNAGNRMAFGVAFTPYIETTSIALLALQGQAYDAVNTSLTWLATQIDDCPSPYSLAWGILALTAYDKRTEFRAVLGRALNVLLAGIETKRNGWDTSTLAVCALALEAVEGDSVFEVRG